jgi:hypothetical protein
VHLLSHLQVPQQMYIWLGIPAIRYTTIQSGVRGHDIFRITAMGEWLVWRSWLLHIHTRLSRCSLGADESTRVSSERMYSETKSIVQM